MESSTPIAIPSLTTATPTPTPASSREGTPLNTYNYNILADTPWRVTAYDGALPAIAELEHVAPAAPTPLRKVPVSGNRLD